MELANRTRARKGALSLSKSQREIFPLFSQKFQHKKIFVIVAFSSSSMLLGSSMRTFTDVQSQSPERMLHKNSKVSWVRKCSGTVLRMQ
jgi:hypothetical protein